MISAPRNITGTRNSCGLAIIHSNRYTNSMNTINLEKGLFQENELLASWSYLLFSFFLFFKEADNLTRTISQTKGQKETNSLLCSR